MSALWRDDELPPLPIMNRGSWDCQSVKLVAKGFFKLGDNGTVIQDLQYTTIATPNLVVAGQSNLTVIVSIDPLQILGNRTIILSPQFSLPQGIIIGYVRGVGGSLIEIQFINASLVPANIGGNYVLAII